MEVRIFPGSWAPKALVGEGQAQSSGLGSLLIPVWGSVVGWGG
jgi:hypothetical protein